MTDDEKKRFIDAANEDKERYLTAMKTYTPPSDVSSESGSEDGGKRRRKRKKKKIKDPKKPKRAMSSFMFFANEQRPNVRLQYPDIKITEIGKRLSELWKALTKEQRQKYVDDADRDKERYKKAMETYTASPPPKEVPVAAIPVQESSSHNSSGSSDESESEEE